VNGGVDRCDRHPIGVIRTSSRLVEDAPVEPNPAGNPGGRMPPGTGSFGNRAAVPPECFPARTDEPIEALKSSDMRYLVVVVYDR
jgi:hypothetical protein